METALFSDHFEVWELQESDATAVLKLWEGNPLYFTHCPPAPSLEGVIGDMQALPPGKGAEDKYYLGFFEGEKLAAVLDLIDGYPDRETAFIGFFMVDSAFQGKGTGSSIVSSLLRALKKENFCRVRLGYVKGNPQSEAFWIKNGFIKTGIESSRKLYTVVWMEKEL